MRRIVYILFVMLCFVETLSAQKLLTGKTSGNKAEYLIGDRIEYSFSIPKQKFETVLSTDYSFSDTLNLISQRTDTTEKEFVYHFVFSSFVGGEIKLPVYAIYRQSTTDRLYSISSPMIRVNLPQIDTVNVEVKALKSIEKVPITFREILPIGIAIIVLVALIVAIVYTVKYLRKKKENRQTAMPTIEQIPEDVEALKSLEVLQQAHYIENNRVKQHYILLTDIVWKYIFRRFGVNAFEMTSKQIIESLQQEQINMEDIERLRYLFSIADLVKFAKHQPTINENLSTMQSSKDFVLSTKRVEEKSENKEGEVKQ